ncbi:hypothetical protein G7Y89_g8774 [Cudoniella acicularis]|uniref:Major facilitator superfamily (MFS) profile domain-containing protein n=1 Tax=Cudoniella acicularis TaxID=354080 RepID=A0A8H4RIK4_9HELO|nr:hypothetical protein G7Y89_g8774 [Cudoniella acicularis]
MTLSSETPSRDLAKLQSTLPRKIEQGERQEETQKHDGGPPSVKVNEGINVTWVVLGYLLSYMGFSIIFARVSDAIGRKSAILIAWFIFCVFSLASGLANSLGQLIVFRIIQGVGGSGMYSMTMIVIPQVTPARHWGAVSGLMGAVFACSSITGPVLGGVITQKSTWRWIYLYNAPAAAVIIIPFLLAWPKSKRQQNHKRTLFFFELDIPGAILLLAASALLVFALQQAGGNRYSWNSPTIISTLVISGISWCILVAWIVWLEYGNSKMAMKAIFPVSIAMKRPVGLAILSAFLAGFPFFVVVINLPTRFQIVNGDGPILSGVHLLPLLASSAFGTSIMCIGTGLLSTISSSREIESRQYAFQVILGLGIGICMSSITLMVVLACNFDEVASAQGAINQGRVLGGSIGLAIATILLNHLISKDLQTILSPIQLENIQKSLSTISTLDLTQQIAVADTFAKSFQAQMRMCLYVNIVGLFVAIGTWERHPVEVSFRTEEQRKLAEAHVARALGDIEEV